MAWNNETKKYSCDYCGNIMNLRTEGWSVGNNGAICPMCSKKLDIMKKQEKFMRQHDTVRSSNTTYKSSGISMSFWEVLWFIFKWIMSPFWGGVYILFIGINERIKPLIIIGVEYTILSLSFIILANSLPELFLDPRSWYMHIIVILFMLNVVALVIIYNTFKDD